MKNMTATKSVAQSVIAIAIGLAFILGQVDVASAQAPATLTHQGYLVDQDGVPYDGNFVVTFRLYDAETDGNELWSEAIGVEVASGLFHTVLGETESLAALSFDAPYWLSIAVNQGAELSPRLPLSSVPYSMHAASVPDGSLTPAKVDAAAGTDGQVLTLNSGGFVWNDLPEYGLTAQAQGDAHRLLLNRENTIGVEWFGVRAPVTGENQWGGMYMETNGEGIVSSRPFYGYAHNGESTAWHEFHGGTNEWRLILRNASNALTTRFKVDGDDGNVYADGTFNPGGADLAEAFDAEITDVPYEPGDVLVISESSDRTVARSAEAYSTLVAGVFATKPGVLLSENGVNGVGANQLPMGVIGVVPTKVTGEGGPIKRGDLLVTSSTPGHAMKADPARLAFGMVLGKALESFDGNGTAKIEVLINVK